MATNKNDALILRRLAEIEESVNLGTLDTTLFGLMVFVFATALALVSMGFPRFIINNPYIFVSILLVLIFVIPLIHYISMYVQTIFFKGGRFKRKKLIIGTLLGELLFIFEMWVFLFIAWIYERWWKTPQWLVIAVILISLALAVLAYYRCIKPGVNRYFNEHFKALMEKECKEN